MNKRIIALSLSIMIALCGCNTEAYSASSNIDAQVELEKTITPESKWINSSIPGAINEDTQVRAQDDFYTYVNKERILAFDSDEDSASPLLRADDLVSKRKIMIASGEEDPDANKEVAIDIPKEYVEHDEELVHRFADAIRDWDSRNSAGSKPLYDYINAIVNISDLFEMSDYILDKNDNNFTYDSLVSIDVKSLVSDPTKYSVMLGRTTDYLLESRDQYIKINSSGITRTHIVEDEVIYALTGIGYLEEEAKKILTDCYRFEGMLADASLPDKITEKAEVTADSQDMYSYEDIMEMQGNYPLCDLIECYGYDRTDEYCVPYADYVKRVGELYKESNLEYIKAYYIVHTIHEAMEFLDKEAYDLALKYEDNSPDKVEIKISDSDGDVREVIIDDEWDVIMQKYIAKYLGEPLEISYLARYCTPEDKEYLTTLTDELVLYYVDMLKSEEWMGENSIEAAIDKLTHLKKHVLYPEHFSDYSDLQFDDDDSLVDMVRKAKKSALFHGGVRAGMEVSQDDWDIVEYPSSTVNAYYVPKENAIYIMAGMTAVDEIYNIDNPYERNLGGIGVTIGHEISHGFDMNGCCFDKDGRNIGWWKGVELTMYTDRTRKLETYYDTLPPAPGMACMSGKKVENEAIADMGGMKACLGVAKKISDFDYDMFFTSYATSWSGRQDYSEVLMRALDDNHPQGFLRTNITLAQFDEFIEAYDVKEGDGMYIAPDDRIAVW